MLFRNLASMDVKSRFCGNPIDGVVPLMDADSYSRPPCSWARHRVTCQPHSSGGAMLNGKFRDHELVREWAHSRRSSKGAGTMPLSEFFEAESR